MAARYNVLFLCNENSARSIFAEALLNHKGRHHFRAFSAGTKPKGLIYPQVFRQLELVHLPAAGLRSKSIVELAGSGAPEMDFTFALCDEAAQEACPAWPGQPITGEWNVPDPAAVKGTKEEVEEAFRVTFTVLQRRIDLLLNLPLRGLLTMAIPRHRRAA